MHLLAICLTAVLFGAPSDDLAGEAKAARSASDWAKLEDVSRRWAEAESQSASARAHLALAYANNRKFDECVASLREIEALQQSIDEADGWHLERRVDTILSELELPAERRLKELSGGWQRRVATMAC